MKEYHKKMKPKGRIFHIDNDCGEVCPSLSNAPSKPASYSVDGKLKHHSDQVSYVDPKHNCKLSSLFNTFRKAWIHQFGEEWYEPLMKANIAFVDEKVKSHNTKANTEEINNFHIIFNKKESDVDCLFVPEYFTPNEINDFNEQLAEFRDTPSNISLFQGTWKPSSPFLFEISVHNEILKQNFALTFDTVVGKLIACFPNQKQLLEKVTRNYGSHMEMICGYPCLCVNKMTTGYFMKHHYDNGDTGLAIICYLGKFKGGRLLLPHLGIAYKVAPGSVVAIKGADYMHAIDEVHGERYSFVFFCKHYHTTSHWNGELQIRESNETLIPMNKSKVASTLFDKIDQVGAMKRAKNREQKKNKKKQ